MLTSYYIFIVLFFLSHSLLATTGVKRQMHRRLSPSSYRLLYNVVSIALLIVVVGIYTGLERNILFAFRGQYLFGWWLVGIGSVLSYVSFKSYNTLEFLGLAEEGANQQLCIERMNRYVRHPLYFSSLILLWGALLLEPTQTYLGFALIGTVYLIVGTKLEEKKLVETFGQDYRDYQERVPMLFPLFLKKGLKN